MSRHRAAACVLLALATFPAAARGDDVDAANAAVERVMETLRALKSYEDRYRVEFVMAGSDIQGNAVLEREPTEGRLAFVAPNRMALDFGHELRIRSDGTDAWTAMPGVLQYTRQPAKGHVDVAAMVPDILSAATIRHPAALVLGQPDLDAKDHFPFVRRWLEVEAQKRDGRPGHRIVGEVFNPQYEIFSAPRRLEMWVDAADGLPRQITVDLTDQMRSLAETGISGLPAKVDHASIVITFEDVRTNHAIGADRFVFEPGPYDAQVDSFTPTIDHERSMLNRPAPRFSGRDMAGNKLALEDLRGRVVVLDFWSIGCGPCIVAMPSLQRLADHFADKPVSIIGINNDPLEYHDHVKRLLERKQVRFQQFIDSDNRVHLAYYIRAVPSTFLIDPKGRIRYVHEGLTRDFQQHMTRMIDALLAEDGEAG